MRKEWLNPELKDLELSETHTGLCFCNNGKEEEIMTQDEHGNKKRPGHEHKPGGEGKPDRPGKPCPGTPVPPPADPS